MAARDKKPKTGSGAPPPEPETESRPKSRIAAAPQAKTKANFKLNMIQAQGVRRRGRPAKRRPPGRLAPGAPGRAKPRDPPPDTKPSLARLVKRKRLVANVALNKKKALLVRDVAKRTQRKPTADTETEDTLPVVKKEPDLEPPLVPDSRPSSPKVRKPRTSSDLSIAMSSQMEARSIGAKSPYSTRSERGNSPFTGQQPQRKTLRNGKQRSLKDALLSESVESEKRKRNRVVSESPDIKNDDIVDDDRKNKRIRSSSRDGSEISKCSDVTESDVSGFEATEIKVETERECMDVDSILSTDDIPIVSNPDEPSEETVVAIGDTKVEVHVSNDDELNESLASDVNCTTTDGTPDLLENQHDDSCVKVEASKINESTAVPVSDGVVTDGTEKIVEKSLILDNMSKTFNEVSVLDSTKSIRRSARQRKITVKAKEHEETILAENALEMKFAMKTSKLENSDNTGKVSENADASEESAVNNQIVKTDTEQCKITKSVDKLGSGKDKKTSSPELNKLKNESTLDSSGVDALSSEDKNIETLKIQNVTSERVEKIDDSSKENINTLYTQDIGKVIDRLKNFEEQDEKKRQEKMSKLNVEKRPVMVTNDVVLIPKSSLDKTLKDVPNAITLEKAKEKDNILNCFDINSSVSIIKKDQTRKSFDIDLPSGVTLIKRSSSMSRKHSSSSNSRDGDTVTMIDKSLGKEVTLDIRKSIDKGIISIEVAKTPQLPSHSVQVIPAVSKVQKSSSLVKDIPSCINTENGETSCQPIQSGLPAEFECKQNSIHTTIQTPSETEIIPIQNALTVTQTNISTQNVPSVQSNVTSAPVDESLADTTGMKQVNNEGEKSPPQKICTIIESPEKQKQKEEILGILGLLPLKAANQAKLDKQKQREMIKSNKNQNYTYTGTLKTVIKLNRNSPDKKKSRSPLKMTFHRNKTRTNRSASDAYSGDSYSDEEPTYTIHKEFGGTSGSGTGSSDNHLTSGGHRKTHYSNRFNNHDVGLQDSVGDSSADIGTNKEIKNLVIPEKASSFGIHPDRLCQDQCSYCGGKFGLYDTPCHIAQMKSVERQKKILDNEEKLDVDSCLCDACYRHVDRRANCPSYRKRPTGIPITVPVSNSGDNCYALSCSQPASHTLRRKWLVKMRSSISKVVQLDLDYPGLHTIPLCDAHYKDVLKLMVCGLCKRRLARNHVHYVSQEYIALNPLLKDKGIPVVFHDKPVVCKLCRYYCTLLLRPPKSHQANKIAFMKSHIKRIFKVHNLEVPDEYNTDNTDESSVAFDANHDNDEGVPKEKKKGKNGKSKSKKSSEGKTDENADGGEYSSVQNVSNKRGNENWKSGGLEKSSQNNKMIMEDIESLISSNKILIPDLISTKGNQLDSSGMSMMETNSSMGDYDSNPLIAAIDKQNEIKSILQKCNLPSTTTLQRNTVGNLSQKSKNILKVHNATSVNKSQAQKKLNRKTQKVNQTQKGELEETLNNKLPNREEFTIEPMCTQNIEDRNFRDLSGHSLLRNIALNDECTIETIPLKSKNTLDINLMKNKWQMTESFSQVKRNLSVLSKNLNNEQLKRRVLNQNDNQLSNPVKRLETNPSISVRELFPGEEEMNLQCSIDFGNVRTVTPEGWEKCNSVIQYDANTKYLWQELQKPYGNQSSFLRHLILLEKYFRNGDLILSHNANCNAITYSESVQNRLRAFDNIPNNNNVTVTNSSSRSASVVQNEFIEPTKRLDNSTEFRRPVISAGKSLLKSNQITINSDSNKSSNNANKFDSTIMYIQGKTVKNSSQNQANDQTADISKSLKGMPVSLAQLEKLGNQLTPVQVPITARPPTPRPDVSKPTNDCSRISLPSTFGIEAKTSTPKSDSVATKPKAPSLPPELIAINQTSLQRKSIESALKNMQQMAKNIPTTPHSNASTISAQLKNNTRPLSNQKDVGKKGKGISKQWRPTLIPITDESKLRANRDVLHQTADGRRLPSLVQVTQGGKPYHITIQDYNRMCILRQKKMHMQMQKAQLAKNQILTSNSINNNTTDNFVISSIKSTSPSPVNKDGEKPTLVVQTNSTRSAETVKPVANKNDKVIDNLASVLPEMETTSLLKNVSLKNVTIAPINTNSDSKTSTNVTSPQSLLLTSAKTLVQVPPIVTQLSPSVSVTTETVMNSDSMTALVPKVVPVVSQTITMPKIPKSLTVIPQTISSNNSIISSTPEVQNNVPLTVLPLPTTTTISTTVTASPSEP